MYIGKSKAEKSQATSGKYGEQTGELTSNMGGMGGTF